MTTKNIIILICLAVIIILGWTFLAGTQDQNSPGNDQNQGMVKTIGTVATTTNGQMMYTNEALGLKFTFPSGWHLGVNTLGDDAGNGYLQLFNYDETKADSSVFPKGNNKIESVITDNNNIATSSDYAEQSRKTISVQITGKTITVVDVTLVGGQKFRAYIIPIQDQSSKFLRMIIYGDPDNFDILDNLVGTIEWLK